MENKKIKILAIDDNPDNLITIKALIFEAFEEALIFTALDGIKGIELALVEDPDVILLDILMPGMDGFEVCRRLKADKKLSDIPVVFVTAIKGDKENRIRGLEVGAEAFLAKPIDESELVAQIRAMIKIKIVNIEKHNEKERLATLVADRTRELKENHIATLNLLDDLKNENEARRKSEEALRINEERFRNISDSISDMSYSCCINEKGEPTIDWIYGACENITGRKNEELIELKCWGKLVLAEDFHLFKKHILDVKPGFSDMCQLRILNTNGNIVWIQASSKCVKQKDSDNLLLFGGIIDITEQKLTDEALRASEALYLSVLNASPDNITVTDLEGKVQIVSPKGVDLLGYKNVQDLLGRNLNEILVPEDRERASVNIQHMFQGIFNGPEEYKLIKADGNTIETEVNAELVKDANGIPGSIVFAVRDITERKIAQEALLESEDKYRSLVQYSSDPIFSYNQDGTYRYVNESFANVFGKLPAEIIGKSPYDILPHDEAESRLAQVRNVFQTGKKAERDNEVVTESGEVCYLLTMADPIKNNKGEVIYVSCISKDITKRKLAEEKLRHVARLFALLSQINEAIVRIHDQVELLKAICQVAIEFGQFHMAWVALIDESDNLIKPLTHAGHEDGFLEQMQITKGFKSTLRCPIGIAFDNGEIINSHDIETDPMMIPWRKEALVRGYRSMVSVPFRRNGNVIGALNLYASEQSFFSDDDQRLLQEIGADITFALDAIYSETVRKQAEKDLERSRKELKTIYDNAPVVMCVVNEDRKILFSNNAFREFIDSYHDHVLDDLAFGGVLGCVNSLDDPRGCGFSPNCLRCSLKIAIEDTFKTGIGHRNIEYSSTIFVLKEAHETFLLGSTALIETDGQKSLLLCLHDISDRKRAEKELIEQKHFFEQVFMQSSVSTQILDREGWCEKINPKLSELFGVKPENIEGKVYNIFKDKAITQGGIVPQLEKVFSKGQSAEWDVFFDIGLASDSQNIEVNDKKKAWFNNWAYPIFEQNGEVSHVIIQHNDITARKMAEEALQENNIRLELAMQVADMAWWQMDVTTGQVVFQKRKAEMLGYSPEIFKHYEDFMALVHPDDQENTMNAMIDNFKGLQDKYEVEYRILTLSGEYKWFYDIGSIVKRDEKGYPQIVTGLVFDITDRKQAEFALKESEQYTNSILSAIPDLMFILDADGVYTDFKCGSEEDLYVPKETLIGKTLFDILPDDIAVQIKDGIDKALKNLPVNRIEYQLQVKNGPRFFECKIYPFGETKTIAMVRDITERKMSEEALQKSEMFLRTFIENVPFEIWVRDVENVGILENKEHVEHFGSILGKTPADLPENEHKIAQLWENNSKRVFNGEIINEEVEYEINQHPFTFQEINFPIYNNDKIIGIAGFNINITERVLIEEAFRESQSLYYSFIEQLPNAVFRKDREGRFLLVNSQFCKLKGLNKEDFIGNKPLEVSKGKVIDQATSMMINSYGDVGENIHELILKTGKFYETEEEYGSSDGEKLYMHVVRMPVEDSYGNIIGSQGIMFDITERKLVEDALNHSQEQLKQFAAHLQNIREEERTGLAREIHDDLGQILVAMKIDLGLMKQKVLKNMDLAFMEDVTNKFDNMFNLLDNTIKTTRRIMTGLRPEVLELLGFVEAAKLYSKDFQERHKIICRFESSVAKLDINSQQSVALYRVLQEALTNVVRHAKATSVQVQLTVRAQKLIMEIIDNGIGFDQNYKVRQDSYGLIGMKERVFLLEGELTIHGEIGNGTTVRIEMPYSIK